MPSSSSLLHRQKSQRFDWSTGEGILNSSRIKPTKKKLRQILGRIHQKNMNNGWKDQQLSGAMYHLAWIVI